MLIAGSLYVWHVLLQCETLQRLRLYNRRRGGDGPVGVIRGDYPNPIFDAYVESGFEAGFPVSEDFNGHQFKGFGRFDMNIWKGMRQSSSETHLKPVRARTNLTVAHQPNEYLPVDDLMRSVLIYQ